MFKTIRKGFTLIELLIVIVIIGVLATAVLSAINPIEQVRKARDAGLRSDSAEILNAIERYYTSFQQFPWQTTGFTTTIPAPGAAGAQITNTLGWLNSGLVARGELKPEFTARSNLSSMYVWHSGDMVRVCFLPTSLSYLSNAGWTSAGQQSAGGTWECVPE